MSTIHEGSITADQARALMGKTVTITSWKVDPFSKKRWSSSNRGRVVEVSETSIAVRDSGTTMGSHAKTITNLDRIEKITD